MTFSYGQWSWLPGWHLPPPGPPGNYGNPGWGPPFSGYLQPGYPQGSPSQHQSPPVELQRVVEEAVQNAVQAILPSTRDPPGPTMEATPPGPRATATTISVTTNATDPVTVPTSSGGNPTTSTNPAVMD